MISRRRLIKLSAASIAAPTIISSAAWSQRAWPNRPVRIVIPFPPGGGADTIARLVAIKMTEVLGQQFDVESKPGAGGNVASEHVARSAPDGYTMFLAGDHHATNNHLNPNLTLRRGQGFRTGLADRAISDRDGGPGQLAATRRWRISSRGRKAEPGKLTYGSPGVTARCRIFRQSCSCAPPRSRWSTCPIAARRRAFRI